MNCILKTSKDFQDLLEQTGISSFVLENKISKWQEDNSTDEYPKAEQLISKNEINQSLKIIDIITKNLDKITKLYNQVKTPSVFWEKIQKDFQIPKEQLELLKNSEGNTIEEKLLDFVAKYNYSVEVNIAKEKVGQRDEDAGVAPFIKNGKYYMSDPSIGSNNEITKEEYDIYIKEWGKQLNTQHHSNLTVPGGTNYTENAIRTPGIINTISANGGYHDNEFNKSRGDMAGWFRSDEQAIEANKISNVTNSKDIPVISFTFDAGGGVEVTLIKKDGEWQDDFFEEVYDEEGILKAYNSTNNRGIVSNTKTLRILELQSFFQKVRDKKELVDFEKERNRELNRKSDNGEITDEEYFNIIDDKTNIPKDSNGNQFLQLLNKDNNWITFFIKSIIQDSAKKGYEKVLFPSGNTASKVEGHTTLEEFKKQKEDRIKFLDGEINDPENIERRIEEAKRERDQIKQELERVEIEGFGALKPIYNFYEITVKNILKKNFKINEIIDEYGNTWNEVEIKSEHKNTIYFSKSNSLQSKFKQLIKLNKKEVSDANKTAIASRVKAANTKLGTSYYVHFNPVGQSDNYTWVIEDKGKGQLNLFQKSNDNKLINEELNNKLEEIVEKLGFTIEKLDDIRDNDGNKLDVVAKLDMFNKLIQYSEGKADISTLPEEVAHLFVELLGDNNPLVKKMIADISKFDIYQEVLDEYSNDSEYLNADGTPNELKLKKEAIGKLLSRKITDKFEDSNKENIRLADTWFKYILAKIKELFRNLNIPGVDKLVKLGKGEIENSFDQIADKILSGNTEELTNESNEVFYQKSNESQLKVVQAIINAQSKIFKDESLETDRYTINNEKGFKSPSEIAKADFKKSGYISKPEDDVNKNAGILFHNIASDYIASEFPEWNKHIKRLTNDERTKYAAYIKQVQEGLKKIVNEAKENGEILLSEVLLANTKTKRAGTVDIIGIRLDGSKDIYDFKTSSSSFVHPNKRKEHTIQLNEYKKLAQADDSVLGLIGSKVHKTRIIDVKNKVKKLSKTSKTFTHVGYEYVLNRQGEITGVPVGYEQTGIKELDNLINKLLNDINILESKMQSTSAGKRDIIQKQIENKKAIVEDIQITKSLKSIFSEASSDLNYIEKLIESDTFDPNDDYKSLSDTLTLYTMLNEFIPKDSKQDKKEKNQIIYIVGKAKELLKDLDRLKLEVIKSKVDESSILGKAEINTFEDVIGAHKETNIWKKLFNGISFSHHPLLITAKKLVDKAIRKSQKDSIDLKDKITEALNNLKKSSGESGVNIFNPLLEQFESGELTGNLLRKHKPEFYKERYKAKVNKDLDWFKDNATFDKEKYEEYLSRRIEFIKRTAEFDKLKIKQNILDSSKIPDDLKGDESRLDSMVESIYKTNTKEALNKFIKENKDNIIKFNQPKDKWINPKYTALQSNKPALDFYNLFTNTINEIRDFVPNDINKNFIPNFTADFLELSTRVGLMEARKLTKEGFVDSLELTYDENKYGKRNSVTGENINAIPILGLKKLEANEKSLDLAKVLFTFADSAYRFKELSGIENSVLMISDFVKDQKILKTDATGENILGKANEILEENNKGNTYNQLKDYIDGVFYNKTRLSDEGIKTDSGKVISMNKAGDKLLNLTSMNNLGLNLFAPTVNLIQGNLTALIQSAKGTWFNTADYTKATGLMLSNDTKAKLILQKFHIIMHEFGSNEAKDLSVLMNKKILDQDHAFSLMRIGENQVQNNTLLAMLLSDKHQLKYSDFDVKDGKLVYKNGELDINLVTAFEQRVLKVNKLIVGNQDSNDMISIKKWWGGRALMQHRGWIPALFEERFGGKHYDYDLDQWIEGRYRTLFKTTLKPLFKLFTGKNEFNTLSKEEWANMRANFAELSIILGVWGLKALLHGDDDDRERRSRLRYLIRTNSRLMSELTFFSSPSSAHQILISPAASISTLENVGKVYDQVVKYVKGEDSHIFKSTSRFVPILGQGVRLIDFKDDFDKNQQLY